MTIDPSSIAFKLLDHLANATNPLLLIALIVGLALVWRQDKIKFQRVFLAAVVSLVLIYIIKHVEGHHHIWANQGMIYSTHSAFAIAMSCALAFLWQRRWWIFAVIFVAYAALMMLLQFHTLADIVTTTVVILPLCLLCHFVAWRKYRAVLPLQS